MAQKEYMSGPRTTVNLTEQEVFGKRSLKRQCPPRNMKSQRPLEEMRRVEECVQGVR